jgi:glycine cleavage system H lipoate-binding protein
VNSSPYEDGWLFKIRLSDADVEDGHLVDHETYQKDYVE